MSLLLSAIVFADARRVSIAAASGMLVATVVAVLVCSWSRRRQWGP